MKEVLEPINSSRMSGAEEKSGSRVRSRAYQAIGIPVFGIAVLGIWHAVVIAGVLPELILPSPWTTFREFGDITVNLLTGGHIAVNLWITAQEILFGFVLAALLGFAGGIVVAETRFGRQIFLPYLVMLNSLPKVAFAPLLVAWFGFGITPKIGLAAFIAFFPIVINTAAGLDATADNEFALFRSLRANRAQTFFHLKLPNALPSIFAGLKTGSVLSVVGAIVGEFLGGGEGLGGLVRLASINLNIPRVFAMIGILGLFGMAFFSSVRALEKRLIFWRSVDGTGPIGA